MIVPEPLLVRWQGQTVRVRHDDGRLTPLSQRAGVIRSAISLTSTSATMELLLTIAVRDHYSVRVREDPDGVTVGLRRLRT